LRRVQRRGLQQFRRRQ